MCSEFLLCFGQWLGEVVFASEQFSHPHASFLSAKVVSVEHTFRGGHAVGTTTKCTILECSCFSAIEKSLLTRIRLLHDKVREWPLTRLG